MYLKWQLGALEYVTGFESIYTSKTPKQGFTLRLRSKAELRPSGRFPSGLEKPDGSRMQGISVNFNAICIKSLTDLCLGLVPAAFMQDKPCVPNLSNLRYIYEAERLLSKYVETAKRNSSSLRCVPRCGNGSA